MVKKVTGSQKDLHAKRLKLKRLHKKDGRSRAELEQVPPDQLPPASSSNAARQVRSRLNNTFPVNWQALHTELAEGTAEKEPSRPDRPGSS